MTELSEAKEAFDHARTRLNIALSMIEEGAYTSAEVPLADMKIELRNAHEALKALGHGYWNNE